MPRYQIQSPDGRSVTVEGDSPPSQEQADKIFSSISASSSKPPTPSDDDIRAASSRQRQARSLREMVGGDILDPETNQPAYSPSQESEDAKTLKRAALIESQNKLQKEAERLNLNSNSGKLTSAAAGVASIPVSLGNLGAAVLQRYLPSVANQIEKPEMREARGKISQDLEQIAAANPATAGLASAVAQTLTSGGGGASIKAALQGAFGTAGKQFAKEALINTAIGSGVQKAAGEEITPRSVIENALIGGLTGGDRGKIASDVVDSVEKAPSRIAEAFKPEEIKPGEVIPEKLLQKQADTYRNILSPGKGEISKLEIKSGKDLDDYYKLAAEEGLVIERSPDNKLDTSSAREQLRQKTIQLGEDLSKQLATEPEKQFSLQEVGEDARRSLRKKIKNDLDFNKASRQLDQEIESAIASRGETVNGPELNDLKQGMWSKSFNPMEPNSKDVAREIGFSAKDLIEASYKDKDIRGINNQLGEYLTLNKLLENAHGRVVSRGKLGKYAAQGIGALAGHSVPVPIGGELAGAWIAGKLSDIISDPERITSRMAAKTNAYREAALANPRPTAAAPVPSLIDPRKELLIKRAVQKAIERTDTEKAAQALRSKLLESLNYSGE